MIDCKINNRLVINILHILKNLQTHRNWELYQLFRNRNSSFNEDIYFNESDIQIPSYELIERNLCRLCPSITFSRLKIILLINSLRKRILFSIYMREKKLDDGKYFSPNNFYSNNSLLCLFNLNKVLRVNLPGIIFINLHFH